LRRLAKTPHVLPMNHKAGEVFLVSPKIAPSSFLRREIGLQPDAKTARIFETRAALWDGGAERMKPTDKTDVPGKAVALGPVDAPSALRQLASVCLQDVLNQHRAWIGSGWELGARADLHAIDLHLADLSDVVLSDADLHDADLHGAHLERADLDGCDLHSAKLCGAHLRAASLPFADLHAADLHGADLHGADLRCADLHEADLTDADLGECNLCGADLRLARGLGAAQLTAARIDDATLLSDDVSSGSPIPVRP
jgi:hypothetical protein